MSLEDHKVYCKELGKDVVPYEEAVKELSKFISKEDYKQFDELYKSLQSMSKDLNDIVNHIK